MEYVVLRMAKLSRKLSTYRWDTLYKHFIKLYMTWVQKKRKVPTRCVLDVAHYIQGSQSIYLRLRKPLFTWKTFDLIDDFPWFFIMWEIEESFFFLFVRAASFPNWKITPGLRDQNMLAIPALKRSENFHF